LLRLWRWNHKPATTERADRSAALVTMALVVTCASTNFAASAALT
jgi:hypothetical protein